MTAPVTVEPQVDGSNMQLAKQWRINFVMPNHYTLASIPKPKNNAVNLREVPSKHFAVLTYSGFNTLSRVQAKTQEAIEWALKKDLKIIGTPQLSRYDPPWTLPMFRRNEIMIEISDK
jgi:SOUL heme-binding protein